MSPWWRLSGALGRMCLRVVVSKFSWPRMMRRPVLGGGRRREGLPRESGKFVPGGRDMFG